MKFDDLPPRDPILGLEEIRRDVVRLSKTAFYGPNGPARRLPVIQLSQRRKGVRKSALDQFLAEQTRVGG